MLATFDKKVPEIDLLVAQGDSVTLGVQAYRPFIQEPDLLGVRKFPAGAGARVPESGPAPGSPAAGAAGGASATGTDTASSPDSGSMSPLDTTGSGSH